MNMLGRLFVLIAVMLGSCASAAAQNRDPHIGYIYPAGVQRGTTSEITVGGQYLDETTATLLSGRGLDVEIVEHKKPMTQKEINEFRQMLQKVQKAVKDDPKRLGYAEAFARIAEEMGIDTERLQEFMELRKIMNDPKRQLNPQIGETVTLRVTCAPDAALGDRELRLVAKGGLTNPLRLYVGSLAEHCEAEPNETTGDEVELPLPVVLNGQILPGDVDRFRFRASQGDKLVASALARDLIPYLADAVPGWFQATLTLYDSTGSEVAFADDFRFDPDPILFCEIDRDGEYILEVRDAIYRGREDFVYRITLGEVPLINSVFPLGGPADEPTEVKLTGWNLETDRLTLTPQDKRLGARRISIGTDRQESKRVPFAVGSLPETMEAEPNNAVDAAQKVVLPQIVNGRIGQRGDVDLFQFEGRAGEAIALEVVARRLGSPLDSILTLYAPDGKELAVCDDHKDPSAGLTTHQADSLILVKLPEDGVYRVQVADTQQQGGGAYAYRLRISPPRPDFAVRVTPASLNARPGAANVLTAHAVRRDGFSGEIRVQLRDAPAGFELTGGRIPAGQDVVRMTLTAPTKRSESPIDLEFVAVATIDGQDVTREVVPAENMMQAFFYRHLVPSTRMAVAVSGYNRRTVQRDDPTPLAIPAGGTARAEFFTSNRRDIVGVGVANPLVFELNQPPAGISIDKVEPVPGGVALVLRAAEDAALGSAGNLIIDAFTERVIKLPDGTPTDKTRRIPVGSLPALPFDVVEPRP